ncbi:MAG: glutaredoxin [Candidatus Hadarchaeota archaeon]
MKLFAISTCPWCKKTKELLESLDLEYRYVDLDKKAGDKKEEVKEKMKEYNPKGNVPTVVVDEGDEVVVGYKEEKIRGILEDE